MTPLTDRQLSLLACLPKQQRLARVAGVLLALVGIVYIAWAITRFDIGVDPAKDIGFDAWITTPIATVYDGRRDGLERFAPRTDREQYLSRTHSRGMNFSGSLMLLGFRITLGLMPLLLGLTALTVYVERARLLRIVTALRDDSALPDPAKP